MYPTLNECFIAVKEQPLYSAFVVNSNGNNVLLRMNESAARILRLCDGTKTIEEIKKIPTLHYHEKEETVSNFVNTFLTTAKEQAYVKVNTEKQAAREITVVGSDSYWTPDTLAIELTENCPLKCRHCYLNAGVGNTMALDCAQKILDEASEFYIENIQLTGGEPLIHPHFFTILDRACSLGARIHISTSGYILNQDTINKLKTYASKKIVLQVSIDGLEEYHDSFRGVQGCFKKSMAFIKEMISAGIKVIVGLCIDTQTYEEIKALCEQLKLIGVSGIRIGAITNRGRAENVLATDVEKMRTIREIEKQLLRDEGNERFDVVFAEESLRDQESEYTHNCGIGQILLKISPIGDVSPCLLSEIVVGNAKTNSLLEIQKTYSRKFEQLRAPSAHLCLDCARKKICVGCITEGLTNQKSTSKCNWFDCQAHILTEVMTN